jgi:hypothetical protein
MKNINIATNVNAQVVLATMSMTPENMDSSANSVVRCDAMSHLLNIEQEQSECSLLAERFIAQQVQQARSIADAVPSVSDPVGRRASGDSDPWKTNAS